MKTIVCISDTHRHQPKLPRFDNFTPDLLIHAGDWSSQGTEEETNDCVKWLEDKADGYRNVIVVPGNHDRWCMANSAEAKKRFADAGITYLEDEGTTYSGWKIYGMPWTPIFGRWAFMSSSDGRKLRCDAIPNDTDILITHGPPKGYLDEVLDWARGGHINVGCEHLKDAVERIQPKLHVFGHIHEGAGISMLGKTLLVNASIMDRLYNPVNQYKIVYL
jgi:Icc-related predicted phosphoesterase